MATSAEIGLAALGAFAASEATGVTDVTSLGEGGGDEEQGGGSGGASPGLGVVASQLAGVQGRLQGLGRAVNQREAGGVSEIDLAAAFDQAVGDARDAARDTVAETAADVAADAVDPNQNVSRTVDTVTDAVTGDGVDLPTDGMVDAATPGIPRTGGGLLQSISGFDPAGAGEAIGDAVGDFTTEAASGSARGVGEAIGSVPFALVGGAIQAGSDAGNESRRWLAEQTGVEPRGTGINDDRPGVGLTDVGAAAVDTVTGGSDGGSDGDGGGSDEPDRIQALPGVGIPGTEGLADAATADASGGDGGSDGSGGSGGSELREAGNAAIAPVAGLAAAAASGGSDGSGSGDDTAGGDPADGVTEDADRDVNDRVGLGDWSGGLGVD